VYRGVVFVCDPQKRVAGQDLGTAQKEELQAEIDFQKLRAAKEGEIKAGSEQKGQKETELSDLLYKVQVAPQRSLICFCVISVDVHVLLGWAGDLQVLGGLITYLGIPLQALGAHGITTLVFKFVFGTKLMLKVSCDQHILRKKMGGGPRAGKCVFSGSPRRGA
jgi:hypothetical protein